MKKLFGRFRKDQLGATAIEYGLISASIAVVIISVLSKVGTGMKATFQIVANAI